MRTHTKVGEGIREHDNRRVATLPKPARSEGLGETLTSVKERTDIPKGVFIRPAGWVPRGSYPVKLLGSARLSRVMENKWRERASLRGFWSLLLTLRLARPRYRAAGYIRPVEKRKIPSLLRT